MQITSKEVMASWLRTHPVAMGTGTVPFVTGLKFATPLTIGTPRETRTQAGLSTRKRMISRSKVYEERNDENGLAS